MSCHFKPKSFFNFQGSCYDKDRLIYKQLHAESVNIFGNNTWYFEVTFDTTYDPLFQEDNSRRIYRKFPLKVYYELPLTNRVYNKFGLGMTDQVVGIVSQEHWKMFSQYDTSGTALYPPTSGAPTSAYSSMIRPRMGDILYFEDSATYYEITDVDDNQDAEHIFLKENHTWYLFLRVLKDEKLGYVQATSAAMLSDGPDIPITSANNIPDWMSVDGAVETEITTRDIMYDPPLTEDPPLDGDPVTNWN